METVLIVDDHAGFRSLARRLLAAEGFDVRATQGERRVSGCAFSR